MRSASALLETPSTCSSTSLATRLPHEIVEIIVTHLSYDRRNLCACSLTCYAWYLVAAPHLHRTLVTSTKDLGPKNILSWPNPLPSMYKLGLLPLVKKFEVHEDRNTPENRLSPERFNHRTLRQFSALSNVQELGIDLLNIPEFMPGIRRYFGHFLPTVRSLALRDPQGSHRQIIYFIGLFQHLEDLKLLYNRCSTREETVSDPAPIPPFAPPLRGRLTMTWFRRVGLLEDMIHLFEGIRFRHMDLYKVDGFQLLLSACAETLETLRLYPADHGEEVSPGVSEVSIDKFSVSFSSENINLSRNKSLRALEVEASSIVEVKPDFLAHVASTITSPAFSEVTVIHRECDFHAVIHTGLFPYRLFRPMANTEREHEASLYCRRFEVLREMRKVRDFRLVLCADVWDAVGYHAVQTLKRAVAAEEAKRGFDCLFPKPTVTYSPRRPGPEFLDDVKGSSYGP